MPKKPTDPSIISLVTYPTVSQFYMIPPIYGDGSKPWYLVNPKIAGKWMFIPPKMYL